MQDHSFCQDSSILTSNSSEDDRGEVDSSEAFTGGWDSFLQNICK